MKVQTDEKEKNEAGNEKPDNADVKKEEKNEEVKEVETQGSDMPKGSKEGSNERSKQPQDKKPVDPKQKDSKEMPPTQDSKEKDPNPPKKDDKGKEKTTPAEGAPPVFVISDFEKKAADEGLLIHPNKVKYMGNIDNMYDERKEQMIKDIDEYKSDKSAKRPDASAKKDQKVTIRPEKCQVFETNDVATMDDDEEGEGEVGDIH